MIEVEGSKIEEREPLFRKTCPYFPPVVERDEHTTVVCNFNRFCFGSREKAES